MKDAMLAFIVYRGSQISPSDIEAFLITIEGVVLYTHICSHPNYAYGDLWERRYTRHHDHPNLIVNPKPFEISEFEKEYPEVMERSRTKKTGDA